MHPTCERILIEARRLFWERGYGATSIADILAAADCNSGSLYNCFPTKRALLVAVLRDYRENMPEYLLEPAWKDAEDPIDRVLALLDGYRTLLEESDFRRGCPIGNLANELPEADPEVREEIAANFRDWARAVAECVAGADGQIEQDPEAVGRFVLAVMEGAVMQSRVARDLAPFDDAVRCLRAYLGRS